MRQWQQQKKKLHQARISEDLKRLVRTLAVINGTSINEITEEAIRSYVQSNYQQIQDYHLALSRGWS